MMENFFDPHLSPESHFMSSCDFPWQVLALFKSNLAKLLQEKGGRIPVGLPSSVVIKGLVHIEDGAKIEENTFICGPAFIASKAEVRFGAYIRGDVYLGAGAVVGHDTEVKHALILPDAKAAHFAYVGDSILGRGVNLGAGTKCANVRVDMSKKNLNITVNGSIYDSGLRKFGVIMGNDTSIGCNSVTNPGTLIGRNCLIYSLANMSGYTSPNTIVKVRQEQHRVARNS